MEELIAKSKAHKAARRAAREDDAVATDALDDAFAALAASGGLLSVRDKKKEESEKRGSKSVDADSRYDAIRRELTAAAAAVPVVAAKDAG